MDDIIPSRASGNPLTLEVVDIAYVMLRCLCLKLVFGFLLFLGL